MFKLKTKESLFYDYDEEYGKKVNEGFFEKDL